jgi:hypothetical protein
MSDLKQECPDCHGYGIRAKSDVFEIPNRIAVVCRSCDGKGFIELDYTPYTARKPMKDILLIYRLNAGARSFSLSPKDLVGDPITYDDFLKGKRPEPSLVQEDLQFDR